MLLLFRTAVGAFIRKVEVSIASARIMIVLIPEKPSKQGEKYLFFFSQTYILHNSCCNPPCCLLKASCQNSQDSVLDKIYKV